MWGNGKGGTGVDAAMGNLRRRSWTPGKIAPYGRSDEKGKRLGLNRNGQQKEGERKGHSGKKRTGESWGFA